MYIMKRCNKLITFHKEAVIRAYSARENHRREGHRHFQITVIYEDVSEKRRDKIFSGATGAKGIFYL